VLEQVIRELELLETRKEEKRTPATVIFEGEVGVSNNVATA
jgi:hypothetical protein